MKSVKGILLVVLFSALLVSSISSGSVITQNLEFPIDPFILVSPTSTYQVWTFDTPVTPVEGPAAGFDTEYVYGADVDENPFGEPTATVSIVSPVAHPYAAQETLGEWLDNDRGRDGVWKLYGLDSITLDIQNDPTDRPIKEMVVVVTYSSKEMLETRVKTDIDSVIEPIPGSDVVDLGESYIREKFEFVIMPNPPSEQIVFFPRFCHVYIDEIEVWTNCVPEPATMCLLAFGGAVVLRRRKK